MALKDNILCSLGQSRRLLEGLVNSMNSREDWLHQVHPKANHPLWVVGHIGLADNMFLSKFEGKPDEAPDGWKELFWFGSEISDDSARYPETDTVVNYWREKRDSLIAKINELDEEVLLGPPPAEGMFAEAPNMGALLIFTSFHEGVHTGQFTIAHRALGHEPLFKPQAQEA